MANIKRFEVSAYVPGSALPGQPSTAKYKSVMIEVDLDHLARTLASKAAGNKTGRAVEAGGGVVARVVR
jgi:hypothetical protein